MGRKPRPLARTAELVRDATLVVIASEDTFAVEQYFELFRSTRVKFEVLGTTDGKSSPKDVIDRLIAYEKKYQIGEGDQLWFVCDTDHWIESNHISNLAQVVQKCKQKEIRVAMSNPCFDLWLLFHFRDAPTETAPTCKRVGELLRMAAGCYNKTRVDKLPLDNSRVREAVRRSKDDYDEKQEIPTRVQTAVHLIVEDLVTREVISIES